MKMVVDGLKGSRGESTVDETDETPLGEGEFFTGIRTFLNITIAVIE